MIQIIPSISIIDGKCARVSQGDFSKERVHNESPIDVARRFEDHGIKVIHLVDLDGARRGSPVNYHILETIAGHTDLEIDFTGGIHTDGDISKAYEYGADYITAASVAVSRKDLFASWIISYGREKITLGADALNGKIAIKGWQKGTEIDLFDHIDYFYSRGLKYVKTTDISRDGVLEGPAFDLYDEILKKFPGICLLASGGVRSVDDIQRLNDMGIFAVIFGRAYYEGKIKLNELEKFLVKKVS
jgi:phosphoribosylformimino-5-aminoimidazole carboxamide ribotide isomerase